MTTAFFLLASLPDRLLFHLRLGQSILELRHNIMRHHPVRLLEVLRRSRPRARRQRRNEPRRDLHAPLRRVQQLAAEAHVDCGLHLVSRKHPRGDAGLPQGLDRVATALLEHVLDGGGSE